MGKINCIMNSEKQVISALKRLLKQQNRTYKDVAKWLSLSEGTVKRLFSRGDIRLDRLMVVLSHLSCDMSDLVSIMNADSKQISQITEAQERDLVADIPALLTAVAVLSRLSFEEITTHYGFSEEQVEGALLKLDKMQIISLLPNNHYQLNVHANFRWQNGGPIQRYFIENLATNYLSKPLEKDDNLLMLGAMLSAESDRRLDALIDDFMRHFQELNVVDRPLPLANKSSTFIVLAKRRHWYSGEGL